MTLRDDDPMLEELRDALAPAEAEPSPAEISALRRAVAARVSPSGERSQRRGFWRSWRPLRVLAVAAVLTFTGTAVAVGTGMPLPIVRTLARALGLPVDSHALTRVKSAMRRLRSALTERDAKAVQIAAADLREHGSALDPAERSVIATELEALLSESDQFVAAEAAQVKKSPPRKRTLSGPGPTADDDDEDLDDDSAEADREEVDPDDVDDDGADTSEPGRAAPDPDEAPRRGRRVDRAGRDDDDPDDDPPGDSHGGDDDDDDIDDSENDPNL